MVWTHPCALDTIKSLPEKLIFITVLIRNDISNNFLFLNKYSVLSLDILEAVYEHVFLALFVMPKII